MFINRPSFHSFLAATLFCSFLGTSVSAQQGGQILRNATPPSLKASAPLQAPEFVESFILPKLENQKLSEQAKTLDAAGPLHFAEPVMVGLSCETFGTWESYSTTQDIWRCSFASPGAISLNLGFSDYHLPPGAELSIYTGKGEELAGPFTDENNEDHGEFWAPILDGDELTLELVVPKNERANVRLTVGQVNHGFRSLKDALPASSKSGSCNVDVACPQGDDWRNQIAAVGGYSFGGSLFCTGTLINNTAQDLRPFFLTANHCGINASNAPSVVVYWNYENTSCRPVGSSASGAAGNGVLNQFSSGAVFRAANSTSDFTLLELDDPIPTTFGLYFAGWDRRPQVTSSAVCIHHPDGDEKRISFENNALQITQYLSETVVPNGSYLKVPDWDLGTTEPGSSGSALFSPEKRIIGQLHGGFAACGNDLSDWFGRFAISWEGQGAANNSLKTWLDPLNLNVDFFDGRFVQDLQLAENVVFNDSADGDGDGFPEPGESLISFSATISNQSTVAATDLEFELISSDPRLEIDEPFATLSSIAPGGTGTTPSAFAFSVSPLLPCDSSILLELRVTYIESSALRVKSFFIPVTLPAVCDVAPEIRVGSIDLDDSIGNGNSNGFPDLGESPIVVRVQLENIGAATTGNTPVQLMAQNSSAYVISGQSVYPPIAQGGTADSFTPLMIGISPSAAEGVAIPFVLEYTLAGGLPTQLSFSVTPGDFREESSTYVVGSQERYGDTGLPAEVSTIFSVQERGFVKSVELRANISHTYVGDNVFTLRTPSGTNLILFNRNGGSSNDFINTVFSDAAATSIVDGFAPYTGSFKPIQPLSTLIGEPTFGNWRFTARDEIAQDSGTVNTVALILTTNIPLGADPLEIDMSIPDPETQENLITTGGTLNLGSVPISEEPAPFQIPIRNAGEGDLYVYSVKLPQGLTMNQPLPIVVTQVAEQVILVLPIASGLPGNYSGMLELETNDPDNRFVSIPVIFRLGEPQLGSDLWVIE